MYLDCILGYDRIGELLFEKIISFIDAIDESRLSSHQEFLNKCFVGTIIERHHIRF